MKIVIGLSYLRLRLRNRKRNCCPIKSAAATISDFTVFRPKQHSNDSCERSSSHRRCLYSSNSLTVRVIQWRPSPLNGSDVSKSDLNSCSSTFSSTVLLIRVQLSVFFCVIALMVLRCSSYSRSIFVLQMTGYVSSIRFPNRKFS